MKRFVCFVLVVFLFAPLLGLAESSVDLSSLSYEELIALKDQINLAIWNSKEWQEVSVPQGVYQVGVDIPEGHRTIKAANGAYSSIHWGTKLDATKKDIDLWNSEFYFGEIITSKTHSSFDAASDKTEIDLELHKGQYVIIDDGNVVFSPYAGKPSLGFK